MSKYILFGAGLLGKQALDEYGDKVICFVDNYKSGEYYLEKKVISLDEYIREYNNDDIQLVICVYQFRKIEEELIRLKIKYILYHNIYHDLKAPLSKEITHNKWPQKIKSLCDKEGYEILEIGSRVVTGANFRSLFEKANYTGFDLYDGPNVDVVGDAHQLSQYFNKKFDLIFCSAVFEHLAMPWIVADEIIKLLKNGGYVFIETHYSFSSHERPWHFFQFSEQALKVLFSENRGIRCIEAGVCDPLIGWFSDEASDYLRGKVVDGLYCHSEFLGQKNKDIEKLEWKQSDKFGMYPKKD